MNNQTKKKTESQGSSPGFLLPREGGSKLKKFTLRRMDSRYLSFEDYIAETEEEAIAEAQRIWRGGEFKTSSVSDNLEIGTRSLHYCKSFLEKVKMEEVNGNRPAFAAAGIEDADWQEGLTKREYLAGLMMQALLSRTQVDLELVAWGAVEAADELLKALERKNTDIYSAGYNAVTPPNITEEEAHD